VDEASVRERVGSKAEVEFAKIWSEREEGVQPNGLDERLWKVSECFDEGLFLGGMEEAFDDVAEV
jgi:hypothetical protein